MYEHQGEPFVMHAGDCVLQPPNIRHRVLEAAKRSANLRSTCQPRDRLALRGSMIGAQTLDRGDACVTPADTDYVLDATAPCEVLTVEL